jgi:hypothetical protein
MPFDPIKLRDPRTTVLPPTPPDPGGDPRRVQIEISIIDRRGSVPRRRPFGLIGWLIVLLLLALAVHAQPIAYEHYQGRNWHGETFRQGTVEDTRIYHNDRRQQHCHSYTVGGVQGLPSDRYATCE